MEPVIVTLAIIAIICWTVSIKWTPQKAPSVLKIETKAISKDASPPLEPISATANFGQSEPVNNLFPEEEDIGKNYEDWKREGDRLWVSQAYSIPKSVVAKPHNRKALGNQIFDHQQKT